MENREITTKIEALDKLGFVASTTYGTSMKPMLRHLQDTVVIVRPDRPIKKYDVVLYPSGNGYLLHRVVAVEGEELVILGDNCITTEKVRKDRIAGVVESFTRKGRTYNCTTSKAYRFYSRFWVFASPVRIMAAKLAVKLRKK